MINSSLLEKTCNKFKKIQNVLKVDNIIKGSIIRINENLKIKKIGLFKCINNCILDLMTRKKLGNNFNLEKTWQTSLKEYIPHIIFINSNVNIKLKIKY